MIAVFKRLMVWLLILVVSLALTGCASEVDTAPRPIDSSVDACAVCNMSIVDMHFAAEIIDPQGRVEKFDDIGCLALYLKKNYQGTDITKLVIYVKDFKSMNWAAASKAYYVQGRIDTPMNFGIIAFEAQAAAQEYVHQVEDGKLMSWEEVLTAKQTVGL